MHWRLTALALGLLFCLEAATCPMRADYALAPPAEDYYFIAKDWNLRGSMKDGYFVKLETRPGVYKEVPLSMRWLGERYYGQGNNCGMPWDEDSTAYMAALAKSSKSSRVVIELVSWMPGGAVCVGAVGIPGSRVASQIEHHSKKVETNSGTYAQMCDRIGSAPTISGKWRVNLQPAYRTDSSLGKQDIEIQLQLSNPGVPSVTDLDGRSVIKGRASWYLGTASSGDPPIMTAVLDGNINSRGEILLLFRESEHGKLLPLSMSGQYVNGAHIKGFVNRLNLYDEKAARRAKVQLPVPGTFTMNRLDSITRQ
jgi:hypothetical protein